MVTKHMEAHSASAEELRRAWAAGIARQLPSSIGARAGTKEPGRGPLQSESTSEVQSEFAGPTGGWSSKIGRSEVEIQSKLTLTIVDAPGAKGTVGASGWPENVRGVLLISR